MVISARLSSTTTVIFWLHFAAIVFVIKQNLCILFPLGKIDQNEDLFSSYPVMDKQRWSLTNMAKTATSATLGALKSELKQAYCESRKLEVDRMGCNTP